MSRKNCAPWKQQQQRVWSFTSHETLDEEGMDRKKGGNLWEKWIVTRNCQKERFQKEKLPLIRRELPPSEGHFGAETSDAICLWIQRWKVSCYWMHIGLESNDEFSLVAALMSIQGTAHTLMPRPACETLGWGFIFWSGFKTRLDSSKVSVRTSRMSCQPKTR